MLLPWALLFAVAAVVSVYISLKTDDGMLRGFGLTFLGINLYTRYFEYFWGGMNKVLFFLILAASLAVIGRYAERIWHGGSGSKEDFCEELSGNGCDFGLIRIKRVR